ncbi:MAG: hypothetical protein ABJB86_16670 [Bacteroidota bacterium]
MHFPNPFTFKMNGASPLSRQKLYSACYRWIKTGADSLQEINITKDSAHWKILAGNIPATADISFTLQITISDHLYTCFLQQYIYHTINGVRMPVESAANTKDYKTTVNVERVIIMRDYPQIFNSLKNYIKMAE